MFEISQSGDFKNTEKYLRQLSKPQIMDILDRYARQGVTALANATPSSSGRAAGSWGYTVERNSQEYRITWTNSDIENGFPVVVMLQHGHGTGTGGYVQGRDFINPALQPIMDKIADEVWKAVTSA